MLTEAGSPGRGSFPKERSFDNYADVFERVDFARFFLNSLLITGLTVLLGLLVNGLAGYALGPAALGGPPLCPRLDACSADPALRGDRGAALLSDDRARPARHLCRADPALRRQRLLDLALLQLLRRLPEELEQAARIDGAGPWRCFFRIVAPASKPVFASVAILTALMQWGSFLWPTLVTSGEEVRPLPVAIASFQTLPPRQWGDILAFGVMMVLPLLVLFLLFQRWFVKGVQTAGLKG